ncbi:Group 3 secretory phospholipase A2 [Platysternon megacephalum]|uniref:Group 3 secretory phospholipase A2 n=1 Tax=Platysternon megacephalum TaxID=55544 RepID=A0A4D9DRH0_9SAUR|nr:Group 3 secretory phospholipase A2 [Platysternon megacephalum]
MQKAAQDHRLLEAVFPKVSLPWGVSQQPLPSPKVHQPHCFLKPETSMTSSTSQRLALQGFNRALGRKDDQISEPAPKVPVVSSTIPCGLPKKAEAFWTNDQS